MYMNLGLKREERARNPIWEREKVTFSQPAITEIRLAASENAAERNEAFRCKLGKREIVERRRRDSGQPLGCPQYREQDAYLSPPHRQWKTAFRRAGGMFRMLANRLHRFWRFLWSGNTPMKGGRSSSESGKLVAGREAVSEQFWSAINGEQTRRAPRVTHRSAGCELDGRNGSRAAGPLCRARFGAKSENLGKSPKVLKERDAAGNQKLE
ncbi:hypothetical protein B0H11DRAFT_1903726 [Mycena galericulata]|nr:hypothetical protein B0H11DRAFT_1903726 [Mycena galericulata]